MSNLVPSLRTHVPRLASRSIRYVSASFTTSTRLSNQGPGTGENFEQANDPNARKVTPNVSKTDEAPTSAMGDRDAPLQEMVSEGEKARELQSPNRSGVWSRSQMPRALAMSGPRFEQTIIEEQPRPFAAIELIHKQPVRWVDAKAVACDGGGGPLGHPKIFINLDKPQVCWCTYCGLPYANTHNKKAIEASGRTTYPLKPSGSPDEVQMPTTPSMHGEIEGQYPILKGELEAESVDKQPFTQR